MASTREQRMRRMLKEELSRIMREELNDPRLGLLSITDVELTPDFRSAVIYVSVYGTPEEQEQTMAVLAGAARFLRGELGKQVDLRYTPELRFRLDRSIERGSRVVELLGQVKPPKEDDEHTEPS